MWMEGGQTGLQGHIMRALCTDLLGEQLTEAAQSGTYDTGQAWYDAVFRAPKEGPIIENHQIFKVETVK